jgi:hypothetical protein
MVVCRVMLRKWVVWWTLAHRRFVSPCFFGTRVAGKAGNVYNKLSPDTLSDRGCVDGLFDSV